MVAAFAAMLLSIRSAIAVSGEYPRPLSDSIRAAADGVISTGCSGLMSSGDLTIGRLYLQIAQLDQAAP